MAEQDGPQGVYDHEKDTFSDALGSEVEAARARADELNETPHLYDGERERKNADSKVVALEWVKAVETETAEEMDAYHAKRKEQQLEPAEDEFPLDQVRRERARFLNLVQLRIQGGDYGLMHILELLEGDVRTLPEEKRALERRTQIDRLVSLSQDYDKLTDRDRKFAGGPESY